MSFIGRTWQTFIDFLNSPPTENIALSDEPKPDLKTAYTETKTETAPPAQTGQQTSSEDDHVDEQRRRIATDLAAGGPLFPQF